MPSVKKKMMKAKSLRTSKPLKRRREATITLDTTKDKPTAKTKRKQANKVSTLASIAKSTSVSKVVLVKESSGIATLAKELSSGSHLGRTASLASIEIDEGCRRLAVPKLRFETAQSKAASAVDALKRAIGTIDVAPPLSKRSSSTSSSRSRTPLFTKSLSNLSSVFKDPSDKRLLEIVFSFDTTGPMYGCLEEVKGRLTDIVQRLQADIPGIRIAIIVHGDYCDADKYVIQWIDFGATLPELCDFIDKVDKTSGGDVAECYELVLQRTREVLSWTPGSTRSLVIIGDASPHEPGYVYGGTTYNIDWRTEAQKLRDMNVRIYSVAINYFGFFYPTISSITGGRVIALTNFDDIFHVIMSISYREGGDDLFHAYESEVRQEFYGRGIGANLEGMFGTLRGGTSMIIHAPTSNPFLAPTSMPVLAPTSMPTFIPTSMLTFTPTSMLPFAPTPMALHAPAKTKVRRKKKSHPGADTKHTKKSIKDGRTKRENKNKIDIPGLNFYRWGLVTSPTEISLPTAPVWWKKSYYAGGYVNRAAIDFYAPAIYEIAVQPPGKKKKYVVYFMAVTSFWGKMMMVDFVLRNWQVRSQISHVVKNGASIYMRCARCSDRNSLREKEKLLDNKYSYLWRIKRKEKMRTVKKGKLFLSKLDE